MGSRKAPGTARALVMAGQPVKTLAVTLGVTLGAVVSGREWREVGLVAVAVLLGRLTVAWVNDVADRDRDRDAGRMDKPVAQGWLHPSTLTFATACATCVLVPLSVANGTVAGVAHLGSVLAGWFYSFGLKRTWLSWLPWAVGFGLLTAFLSYGGWGGGAHGSAPTPAIVACAALLGVCAHFLDALPDLVEDNRNDVRSLPLLVALRIGAARLRWATVAVTALTLTATAVVGLTVGLRT